MAKKTVKYISSGILSASKTLEACSGEILQIELWTDGKNNAELIIYDSPSDLVSADTAICGLAVPGASIYKSLSLPKKTGFEIGLRCELSGEGAKYIIIYKRFWKEKVGGGEK
ncbi:hypothetical protein ES702_07544 [subsurface metagenome]